MGRPVTTPRKAVVEFYRNNSATATARAFGISVSAVTEAAQALGFSKREALEKARKEKAKAKPRGRPPTAFAIVAAEHGVTPVLIRKLVNAALIHDVPLVRGLVRDDLEEMTQGG